MSKRITSGNEINFRRRSRYFNLSGTRRKRYGNFRKNASIKWNVRMEWGGTKILQKMDQQTGERIDTDRAYRDAGLPSEIRDFDVAGEMLQHIGVKSVRLLTNNPAKIAGIESAGIIVEPIEIHIQPDNEIIACDLRSKATNLGHHISEEHLKLNHD